MTDPRNVAHDKRVRRQKKQGEHERAVRPGMKPQHQQNHQHPLPAGHGPDADDPIDQTENPQDPLDQPH